MFYFVSRKVRFLAMTMYEQARHCSFGLTKTFYFVPLKVRFLAMTMYEQARHCSFGLTKTLVCNGLVHRGRFAGVGKSGFSSPPPLCLPRVVISVVLVCNAVLLGFAGNAVACCAFLCFSASSFRCAFVL